MSTTSRPEEKRGPVPRRRKRATAKRTMLTLAMKTINGREVLIELKNGTEWKGRLEGVDRKMNVTLFDAKRRRRTPAERIVKATVPWSEPSEDVVFLRSASIRFVIFPRDFKSLKGEIHEFYKMVAFARRQHQAQIRK